MIDLEGVTKHYQVGPVLVTALDGIDLHVEAGEFVVVLGPSGSGKTTTLNIIGALDTPSAGQVTVAGRDITASSRGEQQRVAIARALATGNPVLLADEPTGELDFKTGAQILELLSDQAAKDRAVLVITHNREISRMADRVVEMSSGKIISDGPPEGDKTALSELHW